MRLSVLIILVMLTSLTLALPIRSEAQWKMVAPNLVPAGSNGAMSYRDGRLWLAKGSVFRSDDLGITWAKVGNIVTANDIQFIDASNGIAACINGTYITRNGGTTWKLASVGAALSACFIGSPMVAAIAYSSGVIALSTDAGASWKNVVQSPASFYITTSRDGSVLYFGGDQGGGFLHRSTDMGATWVASAGAIDFDSFTFGVDSCQLSRVVLSNEDYISPSDAYSQLFLTTDLGATWTNQVSRNHPFFCGSIAVSPNAVYCPSITDGIYRSVDHGVIWTSIGGPSNTYDTRLISAITDNIIVATDSEGNVWRTTNSGGDSVVPRIGLSVQPLSVNFPDTVLPCSDVSMGLAVLGLCGTPSIDSFSIDGADSLNFVAIPSRGDSVSVIFLPTSARSYAARLHIFASGEEQTIPLSAVGGDAPTVTFTTADISNDTIGGSIYVPIISSSQSFIGDLDFAVRYDTTMLVYAGSYQAGRQIDATTARWVGFAHVLFPQAAASMKGNVAGYAVFHIYPKDSSCTSVILDSFVITQSSEICAITASPIISTVCGKLGCGTPLISQFTRYSKIPTLRIIPNPASTYALIHSDADLGEVTIEVFDALGKLVSRSATQLSPNHPALISTELFCTGTYQVRILSGDGGYSLNLLQLK